MDAPLTPTQFAWSVLGLGEWPAPAPRRGLRYGSSQACWLCGGATGGRGWPRASAIPVTFASHSLAAAPGSDAVCEACAALAGGETWQRYVAERSPPGVKTWGTASWRSYSHHFAAPGHHECPVPDRWREILIAPPVPPFLVVISTSGQKNLIFRAPVARSRERFGVQFEEEAICLIRSDLTACLAALEALSALGIAKEQSRSGRYHPESIRRAGVGPWRAAEATLRPWRERDPVLLDLVAWIGRGPRFFDSPGPATSQAAPATRDAPASDLPQGDRFI